MSCQVCAKNEAKYKCPKCGWKYCSLTCYKSAKHQQNDVQNGSEEKVSAPTTQQDLTSAATDPLISKLLQDEEFQKYIKEPVIQYYILVLNEILQDVSLTNEYSKEGRVEIANKKLANLRSQGAEYNELFEEFCSHVIDLL